MHGAAQIETDEEFDDAMAEFEELEEMEAFDPGMDEDLEPDENLGPEPLGEDGPNTREAFEDDDEPFFDEA